MTKMPEMRIKNRIMTSTGNTEHRGNHTPTNTHKKKWLSSPYLFFCAIRYPMLGQVYQQYFSEIMASY